MIVMRSLNLFVLTLLLIINVTGQSFRNVINRHNFGFTLEKQGETRIATASAKVIFYYELPSLSDRNYDNINCSTVVEGMKRPCKNIKAYADRVRQYKNKSSKLSEERIELHLRCFL